MQSLKDKMIEASDLACDIAYSEVTHEGHYFTVRDDKQANSDRVWGWVDGLVQASAMKRIEGRCSLQATIDFDIGEFEESVDKDITWFKTVLARVGKPVRLTKQEMRDRGYVVR